MGKRLNRSMTVALSLVGSAILLYSCAQAPAETEESQENVMTEYSDTLSIVRSQNGRRAYHFTTPLVEGYSMAREPYREFRKGVKITTFMDDSLSTVDAVLTANYAIYYEKRELWEAKGDVVVTKNGGKELYTQQLFWNAKTGRIYSNVDSKIVDGDRGVYVGEGFESDERFEYWRFRKMKGVMEVDFKPTERPDSLSRPDSLAPPRKAPVPQPTSAAVRPVHPVPTVPATPARVSDEIPASTRPQAITAEKRR